MIMFFDVDPSVVLSSSLEASLSSKIKSMFAAPEDNHSKHYLLPESNRHFSTFFLMVKIMKSISDWQKRPESIDPRVLSGDFSKHKAKCGNYKRPDECILHACNSTVVFEVEGWQEANKSAKVLHKIYNNCAVGKHLRLLIRKYKFLPSSIFQTNYSLEYNFYSLDIGVMLKGHRNTSKTKNNRRKVQQNQSQVSRSSYALDQVLDQKEFAQLSDQINLAAHQRQNLIDSLYRNNSWYKQEVKFKREDSQISPYAVAYKQWKGSSAPQQCSFKQTYASALDLVSMTKQQAQVKRLVNEQKLSQATFSYADRNEKLSNIKNRYQEQLSKVVAKQKNTESFIPKQKPIEKFQTDDFPSKVAYTSALVGQNIDNNLDTRQKMVELAVQKELLQRIKKINDQQKQQQEQLKKQIQYQKTCFVDLVKRPPYEAWRKEEVVARPYKPVPPPKDMEDTMIIEQFQRSSKQQKKQVKPKYKLNIENILKIPHRQFLIFYSQNYHQLIGLSSPQEMKAINKYRDEALEKQQAVQKLKQKIANYGPEQIAKLPAHYKEKLFKVLYEEDIQIEKYNQK